MEMPITFNHLVKILWHNIYDSLMFAGLKLSNREDSEIKKPYCISRLHVQYILNVLS